ncbi:GNAT family N-acetyltransferase [Lysinibacillus sp. ZYM-1]|uniref:GNAT family N-acetyltransferase n=1 Tax=Lysinibacillus sp. ZYM-1 TaxID=1681184 RepID=UPI0006CE96E6|nr:GNAT family N-acetyltransferase [Lysinibacillus sp. ZYM-1]KPN94730.1 acetyltransferase [Lysinibacillus sp. ZYM-1]
MFPSLNTDRLVLREITVNDAQAILDCFSNPDVLRHYGQNPLTSLEQVRQIINNFSKNYDEKRGIKWGIELKGQEGLIGTIGFQEWSTEHKRAEISYALFPESWGKGYAREALNKVISFGFQEMKLLRIGAIVFTENDASNKLLTKIGFEKEGLLKKYMHQNNVPNDTYVYSLINREHPHSESLIDQIGTSTC